MVDPIEVTLDSELDAHLKLEAAIEKSRKAYEKHQEMMNKATEKTKTVLDNVVDQLTQQQNKATLSALSGQLAISADYSKEAQAPKALGFLESIIGKLTGSMVASVASGMILADVIMMSVKQSKILSNFLETVGQALGLLVDLILLPFLPALVWALVTLYAGITGFGKDWADAWDTLKKEGLIGLIKLGLTTDTEGILGWIKALLMYIFGNEEEKKAAFELLFKWNFEITEWAKKWGDIILGFFFGTEEDKKKSLLATLGLEKGIINGISEMLFGGILDFFFGSENKSLIKKTIGAWLDVNLGTVTDVILGIISPFLQFFFGGDKTVEKKLTLSVDFLVGAGQWLLDTILKMASLGLIKGWDWSKFAPTTPTGISGGGGSVYTPKEISSYSNSQSSGGNTFIFQGLTHEQLPAKVREILRQDGARYQA